MFELLVSENKSSDPDRFVRNRVRVYLDRGYSYGLWIDEDILYSLLTTPQKDQYLKNNTIEGFYFQVSWEVAQQILDSGWSLYSKKPLRNAPEQK